MEKRIQEEGQSIVAAGENDKRRGGNKTKCAG